MGDIGAQCYWGVVNVNCYAANSTDWKRRDVRHVRDHRYLWSADVLNVSAVSWVFEWNPRRMGRWEMGIGTFFGILLAFWPLFRVRSFLIASLLLGPRAFPVTCVMSIDLFRRFGRFEGARLSDPRNT